MRGQNGEKKTFTEGFREKEIIKNSCCCGQNRYSKFHCFFLCVTKIEDSYKNTFYCFDNELVHLVALKLLEMNCTH